MPGGFIFEKENLTAASSQGGKDKCLIIDPNYAYQVPFTFGDDWSDIKIGMFMSFVRTGESNNDVGFGTTSTADTGFFAGGSTADTFSYFGLVKEGASSALPTTANSSGFIGTVSDKVHVSTDSSSTSTNIGVTRQSCKFTHTDFDTQTNFSSPGNGVNKFISSFGANTLQESEFNAANGNFNVVGLTSTQSSVASPSRTSEFCAYWGLRFQVLNKGATNQTIKVTASFNDSVNNPNSNRAISDPGKGKLVNILNGISEINYTPPLTNGFSWNNGVSAYDLPDSLFIYNGFPDIRPRIHAWAAKKNS